jgi:hypothetical protein
MPVWAGGGGIGNYPTDHTGEDLIDGRAGRHVRAGASTALAD